MKLAVRNRARKNAELTISVKDFGGSGPIALLHHANGFCAGTWALVAQRLTEHYRVFGIDARGHGDSDGGEVPLDFNWNYLVDDLIEVASELCRQCGVDQIAFGIGSSFGGIITAAAAAREPDLFGRIALLDPPIHPTNELVEEFHLDLIAGNPRQEALVEQTLKRRRSWPDIEQPRSSWRDKAMFAAWSDEAFELYLAECLAKGEDGSVSLKCDPAVEAHIFESTGSLGVLEYAPRVNVPALYVRATEGVVPAEFSRAMTSLFPAGQYDEIRGGHLLPLEVPDAVANRLLEFDKRD